MKSAARKECIRLAATDAKYERLVTASRLYQLKQWCCAPPEPIPKRMRCTMRNHQQIASGCKNRFLDAIDLDPNLAALHHMEARLAAWKGNRPRSRRFGPCVHVSLQLKRAQYVREWVGCASALVSRHAPSTLRLDRW